MTTMSYADVSSRLPANRSRPGARAAAVQPARSGAERLQTARPRMLLRLHPGADKRLRRRAYDAIALLRQRPFKIHVDLLASPKRRNKASAPYTNSRCALQRATTFR